MTTELRWHGYKYMPYEKRLAALEVARLTNATPVSTDLGLRLSCHIRAPLARRFTYFADALDSSGTRVVTDQARFEASAPRNGQTGSHARPLPRLTKQATRYSAHGLHEYRGKFNPQVVRATTNILRLRCGSLVLDPFCGSGTVLLEAAHFGLDAAGFDVHPLAVEIANAKLVAFQTPRREFRKAADALIFYLGPFAELQNPRMLDERLEDELPRSRGEILPNLPYLRAWFPAPVIHQLAFVLSSIDVLVPTKLRGVFRVILSDIVRDVSWQEPADLRIRRRRTPARNYPAIALFLDGVQRKTAAICATPVLVAKKSIQAAFLADSREAEQVRKCIHSRFGRRCVDAVISSPPYATALPYVDMHRLSMCLLGLINDREIRDAERVLIGNREITDRERRSLEDRITRNAGNLPRVCHDLCVRMLRDAAKPGNGFRRRNTPALLYKYLEDMQVAFRAIASVMKHGAPLAFVIGPNRCSLGGSEFAVDTPALLSSIGDNSSFDFAERFELDAYQRFDLHQQNSIRKEVLLVMRRR